MSRSRLLASSLQQRTRSRTVAFSRKFSAPPPAPSPQPPAGGPPRPPVGAKPPIKSSTTPLMDFTKNKGPVSWMSLFLVGVAAASVTAYYKLERERRLEKAMRKVVSSESDGWSPNPEVLAKRKFKRTPWGWFPEEDAFGAGESTVDCRSCLLYIYLSVHAWAERVESTTIAYTVCSSERSCFFLLY